MSYQVSGLIWFNSSLTMVEMHFKVDKHISKPVYNNFINKKFCYIILSYSNSLYCTCIHVFDVAMQCKTNLY